MPIINTIRGSEMLRRTGYYDNPRRIQKLVDNEFVEVKSGNTVMYYKPEDFVLDENTIFAVLKNADFTEGRGPMLLHSTWKDYDKAVEFILEQEGIFGSKQSATTHSGININGAPYVNSSFNGYCIVPMKLR